MKNGHAVNVAAVLRTAEAQTALKEALGKQQHAAFRSELAKRLDAESLHSLKGDVIVVEIDLDDASEMQVLASFIGQRPADPVVVTSPKLDLARVRELMRIGVHDVIPQPVLEGEVDSALRSALQRRRAPVDNPRGRVVSFIKAGGGVGATSLAVHGAYALSRGKNAPSLCLLDLDLQFGTAALVLDAEHKASILDVVRDTGRLDGALLRAAMARPQNQFDLLPAAPAVCPLELDPQALADVVAAARLEYALTIIDLPLLWSDWSHAVLERSDLIALVVHLTIPSLRQARRQIETLVQENLGGTPLVVIANRVRGGLFGHGVTVKEAQKALGRAVDFTISDSPAMAVAADLGQPLQQVKGGRSLDKEIAAMMKNLFRSSQPQMLERGA